MFLPEQPIRFEPIFRSYIWGGDRLASHLGKKPPGSGIWAESWEIVDHREGESVVADGLLAGWTLRQLIESFPMELIGNDTPGERFPLLLKYLDCERVLSVQVHPNDEYGAQMTQPDRGKTEAWYVIEAVAGAKLYAGLKPGVDRPTLEKAVAEERTEDCLHVLYPKSGDCVFIPAGTLHALGEGLLVAEIQQASDCTFRLYDWNRVDKDGKPRQLHIEQVLEVTDFESEPIEFIEKIEPLPSHARRLVDCDKFVLDEYDRPGSFQLKSKQWSIVTVPKGSASIRSKQEPFELLRGQTLLVPAACTDAILDVHDESVVLVSTP